MVNNMVSPLTQHPLILHANLSLYCVCVFVLSQVSSSIASHCSISGTETESRIQNVQEATSQDRPTSSPEVTPNRRTQTCCFCWCCSCSRSVLCCLPALT